MELLRPSLALRHLIILTVYTLCLTALEGSGVLVASGSTGRTDATSESAGGRGMRRPKHSDCRYVAVVCPGEPKLVASSTSTKASKNFEQQRTARPPQQTDVRELKQGQVIEREMTGGEGHTYQIALTAGQYLKVVVEQKGIDVVVSLFDPNSLKLTEVDSPNGPQGPEPVSAIADASGEYRLEVKSLDEKAAVGRYEIKIEELRESTAKDRGHITGERALAEAEQLRSQGTAESLRKAIDKYNEALPILRTEGDRQREAEALTSMGLIWWQLSENQKAIDYQNQALPLRRAVGDRRGEAITLSNIGIAYMMLGQLQEALPYLNQALPLSRSVGDRPAEAISLNNIAVIYSQLGDFQKALELYKQVLSLRRAVGDRRGEAITLSNIGVVYSQLGDLQKSLEYHSQSLLLHRVVGDRQNEATTLQSLGAVYGQLGDLQKALQYLDQALALSRAVGDRRLQGYELSSIGRIHKLLGETYKALENYNQSLSLLRAVGDQQGEVHALNYIGDSYIALGDPRKALEYHLRALPLSRSIGNRLDEAATLYGIARAESKLGDGKRARTQIEVALDLIESTRSKLVSQQLRSYYLASKQDFYELYTELLMQMHRDEPGGGHDFAALQAGERARARSLLDLLAEARADIRQGVDPGLVERERSLQQRLDAKAERLTRLLGRKHTDDQEKGARTEVEALLAEYEELQAQIRAKSPRYAALTQPQPLGVREIQKQVLDEDTLLLEYALCEERSYLWAVTPTSIASFELPKRAEIEVLARRVYETLTARNNTLKFEKQEKRQERIAEADSDYVTAATALSQMVLGPVVKQLERKRLLIVSAGALQYVPFAALPIPSAGPEIMGKESGISRHISFQPLVVNHEIVSLPSASILAELRKELIRRQPSTRTVAVLADPVFQDDDPRVNRGQVKAHKSADALSNTSTEMPAVASELERSAREVGDLSFNRLPHTRQEAEAILAVTSKGMGTKSLDFEASRATATSSDLSHYRIIHFATHALLNSQHPELSGVVLSLVDREGIPQNGFLRLYEIYNMKLGADLVVLSACRTALGKEIKGEGLVGLTRGFMYAGAARVVASLWGVEDKSTAELMKKFYYEMLVKGQRPAAALRTAQVRMWREKQLPPYYWAAFVLQGEWK